LNELQLDLDPAAAPATEFRPPGNPGTASARALAWKRYAARLTDVVVFTAILDLIPAWNESILRIVRHNESLFRLADGVFNGLAWVPVESIVVTVFLMTPGKWLYGLRIAARTENGASPWNFVRAFKRSLLVFLAGLGAGIRPITLLLLALSWYRFTNRRSLLWDDASSTEVRELEASPARIAAAVAVTIGAVLLLAKSRSVP
jgi:hypothetical protein